MRRVLIAIVMLALVAGAAAQTQFEPAAQKCSIGRMDPQRPEKWQFYLTTVHADGKEERKWISEHDSSKDAMKACEKVLASQNKDWKKQDKEAKGKHK